MRGKKLKSITELINSQLIGRVVANRTARINPIGSIVLDYNREKVKLKNDRTWEYYLDRDLFLNQFVFFSQTHDISRDEDFIRLIKEGRIHEDDILENPSLYKVLVVALAPETLYPIHEVGRCKLPGSSEDGILYAVHGVINDVIAGKIFSSSTEGGREFAFYDAKLKARGL